MDIKVFSFSGSEIRTTVIDDVPYFVGKDVAVALGYSNPRKALLDHVDDDDKGVTKRDTPGGVQELTIINESGLYALIFGSKLPAAKKFKRWVTSEVLPAIRKTGSYTAPVKTDSSVLGMTLEYKGVRVIPTQQLADFLGVTKKDIEQSRIRFIQRFEAGKHFFVLTGDELKSFREATRKIVRIDHRTKTEYLWTEAGAQLHAQLLRQGSQTVEVRPSQESDIESVLERVISMAADKIVAALQGSIRQSLPMIEDEQQPKPRKPILLEDHKTEEPKEETIDLFAFQPTNGVPGSIGAELEFDQLLREKARREGRPYDEVGREFTMEKLRRLGVLPRKDVATDIELDEFGIPVTDRYRRYILDWYATRVKVSKIAEDFGLQAKILNQLLADYGIQYKDLSISCWRINPDLAGNGYTITIPYSNPDREGTKTSFTMYWTRKGWLYLYSILRNHGYGPIVWLAKN